MRVKGAFPVRWKPQDGADGTGITVSSTTVKWASSSSGTSHPTSGWQTTVPSVANGLYLWTWNHIVYSDGTYTDMYSVSRMGIDGKGIQSSVVKYCQKANTNTKPEDFAESDWGDFPTTLTDGYWLYTRTHIVYSDSSTTNSYSVAQVGVGAYYAGVQEYYAAGTSPTTAPNNPPSAGTYVNGQTISFDTNTWKQERPTLNTTTPYLWNFEISADSRGNRYVTGAICIGNFAKGISSIVETYAISASSAAPTGRDYPSDISSWVDESQDAAPTAAKPFQWNKTETTYNDGTKEYHYHVSAVRGNDGKGTVYIDLDNKSDKMLYDGAGNLVGGSSGYVYSNIRLYDNGADVTSTFISGSSFSIQEKSSTVTASIINNTQLRVTGITSDTGYVIVRGYYNGVWYYARFTVSRIVGVDKYQLELSLNAVNYNSSTNKVDGLDNESITIKIKRTAQNGTSAYITDFNGGNAYGLYLYLSPSLTVTKNTSGGTITISTSTASSNQNIIVQVRKVKSGQTYSATDSSTYTIEDDETISINKVTDGSQGYSVVTSVPRNGFTEAQWATYGTIGHTETWSDTSSIRNGARIGDLFTVVGKATDTGKGHTATYRCTNSSGNLAGTCISHEVTDAGDDAVTYDIQFTSAWARVNTSLSISAQLRGYAYKIVGSTRTVLTNTTIRIGYIINDSDTYTTITTNASTGYFQEDNWFDGDEYSASGYSKGSKSIFAAIIINGSIVCTRFVTIVPDGATGAAGDDYLPIDNGIYNSGNSYSWRNGRRDFVDYEIDGSYYRFGVKTKGQTVAAGNAPVSGGNSYWEQVHHIKTLITECVFGTNANIGGFLASASTMVSQNGSLTLDGAQGLIKLAHESGYTWQVLPDGRQVLGIYTDDNNAGERIEIDPLTKEIRIYDEDGLCTLTLNGRETATLEDIFGNNSGTVSLNSAKSGSATTGNAGSTTIDNTVSTQRNMGDFYTSCAARLYLTGTLKATGSEYEHNGSADQMIPNRDNYATVTLRVLTYSDSNRTTLKKTTAIAIASSLNTSSGYGTQSMALSNISVDIPSGYHRIQVQAYGIVFRNCVSVRTVKAEWSITAASYSSDIYLSRIMGNGLAFGSNQYNLMAILNIAQNNIKRMFVKAITEDYTKHKYGFLLDNDKGFQVGRPIGTTDILMASVYPTILYCYVVWNSYTSYISSQRSFNGNAATLSWISGGDCGRMRITFPSGFSSLGLGFSNCIATVTAVNTVNRNAHIYAFTSTSIDIECNDDTTNNESSFILELRYMG